MPSDADAMMNSVLKQTDYVFSSEYGIRSIKNLFFMHLHNLIGSVQKYFIDQTACEFA